MITILDQLMMVIILVILYVFDIRYQKNFESAQPIKAEFRFEVVVPAVIYGYALMLTNRLVSISSDGQRHFDLI